MFLPATMANKYKIIPQNEIDLIMSGYLQVLTEHSDEQLAFKHGGNKWSLKQMYSHLLLMAEDFYLPAADECLAKTAPYKPGNKNIFGLLIIKMGVMPPLNFKVTKTLEYTSEKHFTKQELEEKWLALTQRLNELNHQLAHADMDYKVKLPALGWLNAAEWLQVCLIHLKHHLKQRAELVAYLKA